MFWWNFYCLQVHNIYRVSKIKLQRLNLKINSLSVFWDTRLEPLSRANRIIFIRVQIILVASQHNNLIIFVLFQLFFFHESWESPWFFGIFFLFFHLTFTTPDLVTNTFDAFVWLLKSYQVFKYQVIKSSTLQKYVKNIFVNIQHASREAKHLSYQN